MRRLVIVLLTAMGCVGGAWVGQRLGRASVDTSEPVAASAPSGTTEHERSAPGRVVQRNPGQLIDELLVASKNGDIGRRMKLSKELGELEGDALSTAFRRAEDIGDVHQRAPIMEALLGRLAETDSEAALQYLLDSEEQNSGCGSLVFAAIAKAQGGAVAFESYQRVSAASKDGLGFMSISPMFEQWARDDVDGAMAAIKQIEGKTKRHNAIFQIIEVATEPAQRPRVFEWAMTLEDTEERTRGVAHIAEVCAGTASPQAVVEWLDASEDLMPEIRAASERGVSKVMLRQNPQQGADWLMAHASEDERGGHLAFVVEEWGQHAPNATGRWLGEQKLDAGADPAVAAFARIIVRDDPESALEWAKSVHDPGLQAQTIETVFKRWGNFDPPAAAAARAEVGGMH